MYIDFEGISGSGKSAIAARVAARLGRLGHKVHCARPPPLDPSPLHPRAWLFLELSRQLQLREEAIRPALRRGELCLTEGSLHGHWAMAQAGLGLPASTLGSAFALAEAGLQPDLVVLLDVDPELARWRRMAAGRPGTGPWSRGVEARARRELLALAWKDPARWLVVENEARAQRVVEERIVSAILTRLGREQGQVEPLLPPAPPPPLARVPEELESAFFRALDRLEDREPSVCALLLAGERANAA
jgi:dTMP kinase